MKMIEFFASNKYLIYIFSALFAVALVGLNILTSVVSDYTAKNAKESSDGKITSLQNELKKYNDLVLIGLSKIIEEVRKNSEVVDSGKNAKVYIGKNGGAFVIKTHIRSAPGYIFNYGSKNHSTKNRLFLYIGQDEILKMGLYDNEEQYYELFAPVKVGSHSYEILCLWNKEYGVIALYVNGEIKGKIKVGELNIKPIEGEISFGSYRGGEQVNLIIEEVRAYSFKIPVTQYLIRDN